MPKNVDHDVRRDELAESVWRIVQQEGWEGLTVRRIADESGWSVGALAHYFPSKDGLLLAAYSLALRREADRFYHDLGEQPGLKGLRAAVCHNLCLYEDSCTTARVWLAFLPRAGIRDDFRQVERENRAEWERALAAKIAEAIAGGEAADEMDVGIEAAMLASFLDGLALEATLSPDDLPPERQLLLLDSYLKGRGLLITG